MHRFLSAAILAGWMTGAAHGAADEFTPEEGFTLLFNGKDLTGWKVQKGDVLDGKTETPGKRFQISDGIMVIDGKGKGAAFIQTTREFAKDLVIRFQFNPGAGCNNDVYLRGMKFDIKAMPGANLRVGEWNELEITVQGKDVKFKVNGMEQKAAKSKDSDEAKSPLTLRAEIGPIQFRRIRVKETP